MKKTITFMLAAACIAPAMAVEYKWTPVDETGDWASSKNWTKDGVQMTTGAPFVGQYGTVTVDGKYTVVAEGDNIDAWGTLKVLNGANVTWNGISKLQNTTLQVDANSFLTLKNGSDGAKIPLNTQFAMTWTIYGVLNTVGIDWQWKGDNATTIDLGLTGIVNYLDEGTDTPNGAFKFTASFNLETETTGAYGVVTRELVTGMKGGTASAAVNADLVTITGLNGEVDDISKLALTAENLGKYQLVGSDNGKIYVSYIAAVPEPATATLSLLALAGLAARRRRK